MLSSRRVALHRRVRSIESPHNPLLKEIRKAAASGGPTDSGLVIAEGPHLLEEAARGGWAIEHVLLTPDSRSRFSNLVSAFEQQTIQLPQATFERVATTGHTQGVLTLLRPRQWTWDDLCARRALTVVLDGVQDPGNAGAMVRSAEAFGATGIVFLRGSVRVSNPKFLRATAGSIFRLPFVEAPQGDSLWAGSGLSFFALDAGADTAIEDADLVQPCAIAVGSEGAGVSPELLAQAKRVRVRAEKVESLNAAVACSIALYVAARQRGAK